MKFKEELNPFDAIASGQAGLKNYEESISPQMQRDIDHDIKANLSKLDPLVNWFEATYKVRVPIEKEEQPVESVESESKVGSGGSGSGGGGGFNFGASSSAIRPPPEAEIIPPARQEEGPSEEDVYKMAKDLSPEYLTSEDAKKAKVFPTFWILAVYPNHAKWVWDPKDEKEGRPRCYPQGNYHNIDIGQIKALNEITSHGLIVGTFVDRTISGNAPDELTFYNFQSKMPAIHQKHPKFKDLSDDQTLWSKDWFPFFPNSILDNIGIHNKGVSYLPYGYLSHDITQTFFHQMNTIWTDRGRSLLEYQKQQLNEKQNNIVYGIINQFLHANRCLIVDPNLRKSFSLGIVLSGYIYRRLAYSLTEVQKLEEDNLAAKLVKHDNLQQVVVPFGVRIDVYLCDTIKNRLSEALDKTTRSENVKSRKRMFQSGYVVFRSTTSLQGEDQVHTNEAVSMFNTHDNLENIMKLQEILQKKILQPHGEEEEIKHLKNVPMVFKLREGNPKVNITPEELKEVNLDKKKNNWSLISQLQEYLEYSVLPGELVCFTDVLTCLFPRRGVYQPKTLSVAPKQPPKSKSPIIQRLLEFDGRRDYFAMEINVEKFAISAKTLEELTQVAIPFTKRDDSTIPKWFKSGWLLAYMNDYYKLAQTVLLNGTNWDDPIKSKQFLNLTTEQFQMLQGAWEGYVSANYKPEEQANFENDITLWMSYPDNDMIYPAFLANMIPPLAKEEELELECAQIYNKEKNKGS